MRDIFSRKKDRNVSMPRVFSYDSSKPRVHIYNSESLMIEKYACKYPNHEIGGDLFGHWTHRGNAVVSLVIGPGLNSRRTETSFFQDEHYLRDRGIELYDRYGIQHIGAWHSHHRLGLNEPSAGDDRTVLLTMSEKKWSRFLLLIVTLPSDVSDVPVRMNYFKFVKLVNEENQQEATKRPMRNVRQTVRQIDQLSDISPFRMISYVDIDEREKQNPQAEESMQALRKHWLSKFTPPSAKQRHTVVADPEPGAAVDSRHAAQVTEKPEESGNENDSPATTDDEGADRKPSSDQDQK